MQTFIRRIAAGAVLAATVGGLAAPAFAYDGHRDHRAPVRVVVERHDARWHHWHDHGRVYYGDRVYVEPPPVVYYAPPPPPPGLNLNFSFGR